MTLEELETAVEAIPGMPDDPYDNFLWRMRSDAIARAWRAAFEWRHQYKCVEILSEEGRRIFDAGMLLIERLK